MIDTNDNRLLMSDSLRGMVPELEDEVLERVQDGYISIALLQKDLDPLTGICVGISYDATEVKIDMRVELHKAYQFMKRLMHEEVVSQELNLSLSNDFVVIHGPHRVKTPRLTDFDHSTKLCTLGIDLFKM